MDNNSNKKKVILSTIVSSILLIALVSLAYFAIAASNTNHETISTTSAKISLIYTDCAESMQSDCANITQNLRLGDTVEKTFKVKNDGTEPVDYKIIFKQLINTFVNGDLVYTIEDLNGNILQSERPVPYASIQTANVNAFLDTIPANTTKQFKMIVKFRKTTDDQTVNVNATYSIKLGLTTQNRSNDYILKLVQDESSGTINVITKSAPSGASCTNTFAYDGTNDNNLRYVGQNPCNYVKFNCDSNGNNCESWRIIGIMNNVDDGSGNIESRIKLVRTDSLGDYSWDSSSSEVNNGRGVNDWS